MTRRRFVRHLGWVACVDLVLLSLGLEALAAPPQVTADLRARLTITTPLTYSNTPLDPTIDFGKLICAAGVPGVLDPNSITISNAVTGMVVPHALGEDFAYGDRGRVEFVVINPRHTDYEIRFRTVRQRSRLSPPAHTPLIGVGDLLRYNAQELRPVTVVFSPGLHDLSDDGRPDLTGTWNYARRPGQPWDGIICYPCKTGAASLEFGNLTRLRYATTSGAKFFSHTYMAVDFADFNQDGRLDLVTTRRGANRASFYLNTGDREMNGMPRFEPAGSVRVSGWQACRAVDLNGDGAIDLVVDSEYVRNDNPGGWPFQPAKSVQLDAGRMPCFLDVDRDRRVDSVCLRQSDSVPIGFYEVAWRKQLGGDPPQFGAEHPLSEVDVPEISLVTSWHDQGQSGLIVQHSAFQELSIYRLAEGAKHAACARFRYIGRADSRSAVMALGDQAWPCLCDWDGDGDLDLLVGGGYGWPRIVINDGTRERPAWREPMRILAAGRPIRFLRNEILGKPANWHNMGYPYPDYVDWDADGLPDLVCPNETNRIFWYKNVGTRRKPEFGSRRQVRCDGYPDSLVLRSQSNRRANDPESNNGVYPLEPDRPFMWRTGAALADFNADGLIDLITHDGESREATLFVQYRNDRSSLRLRKHRVLKLPDGRPINDTIVDRRAHWTESFRAVDWNADGLQDLIYSVAGAHAGTKDGGSIYLLRNVGTTTEPQFGTPETMRCFGEPIRITNHGPHPWAGDFDGDGRPDLVACVEWSVYPYYRHAALMMKKRPAWRIELLL